MESSTPARVLVVAYKTAATPALIEAVRERAGRGPAQFTLLIPNPAHGLHAVVDPEDVEQTEGEQVAQRLLGRPERELVPRKLGRREGADLGRLIRRPRLAVGDRIEDDEHDAVLRARVDAEQAGELDVDLELLARLADGRLVDRLPEVDEAAGEGPQSRARLEAAAQEPHAPVGGPRGGAGDGLGV